jgi:signal transduction histidine kinase
LKIKFKLIGSFTIIIGLTILLGIFTIINLDVIQENYEEITTYDIAILENSQLLQKYIVDAETGQRGFIITGDGDFLEPYYSGIENFDLLINEQRDLLSSKPSQIERLNKIESLFDQWINFAAKPEIEMARKAHQAIVNSEDNAIAEIIGVIDLLKKGTGKSILDNIRGEFEIFIELEREDASLDISEEKETYELIHLMFILGTGIIVTVGGIIALYSANAFTKPLIKLGHAAKMVAARKEAKIDIKGNDEITDLSRSFKQMADELRELDKKKEEFISMVSHELKTPLVPIALYAELLLDTENMGKLNEAQTDAVKNIHESMNDLKILIGDVLDVNKLELGKLKLRKRVVNVQDFVNETFEKLKPFTEPAQAKLILDMKIDGQMDVDTNRVFQVISNLVKNAIKFVPENEGIITIRVNDAKHAMILFSIEDNGVGIPLDNQGGLFQKFYQIDSSTTRDHGGTGLGLSISQGIVENHGGKIWYDNDYKGGAKFKFTLPRIMK